jgi:hypothetical protein
MDHNECNEVDTPSRLRQFFDTHKRRVDETRRTANISAATHVLVPQDSLLRRRDSVEVIGAALTAKAQGKGHRRIAQTLGRPASTVRGWLRAFSVRAEAIRQHFVRRAYTIDPNHDDRSAGGSTFADAVDAIGMLGIVAVRRFGPRSAWSLASFVTGGGLLYNTSWPFRPPA